VSSTPEADKIIRAWGKDNVKRKEQGRSKVSARALKELYPSVLEDSKEELIRTRWRDYLNPSTNASPFTSEEDKTIITNVPEGSTAIKGTWVRTLLDAMSDRRRPQVVARITELGLCRKLPKPKRHAPSQGEQTKKKQKKQQKHKKQKTGSGWLG
jgi:hypothetical protein